MILTLEFVTEALEETTRDLMAFRTAYNSIHKRVQEVKDENKENFLALVGWAGTDAVTGSLTMALSSIDGRRRQLLDMKKLMTERGLSQLEVEES